jgi:hypothetical protein
VRPDSHHLAERAARLGMLINIMLPALVAIVAYGVHTAHMIDPVESFTSDPPILFIALGAVAISELVAAYIMRRVLFSRERTAAIRDDAVKAEQWVMRSSLIIFVLGASPMIYGVILYLLSGDLRQLAFFGIITLVAYRLFRPTEDLIEEALQPELSSTGVE